MRQLPKTLLRLNLETRAHHAEASASWAHLIARDRAPSHSEYVDQLVRTYGFEAPLEAALAYTPHLDGFIRTHDRFRSGLIAQDLMNLGFSASQLARLPQCPITPFASVAQAAGWLYAHEHATLIHDAVRREIDERAPSLKDATAYLAAYAETADARWEQLGEALERIARTSHIEDRVVSAAHDAFRTAREWYASAEQVARRA